MSDHGHHHPTPTASAHNDPLYRKTLWVALTVNIAMFGVELVAGVQSGSVSLLADAIDFFGDAANYGVSLAVLSAGLLWRARAALVKSLCMLGFGLFVAGRVLWSLKTGTVPGAMTMGAVGTLALVANVGVAAMLYAWREGDANMRSVWLCSRNDALGNLAVMGAAVGVFGTSAAWPDLVVATGMAALAISGGWSVLKHARSELKVT